VIWSANGSVDDDWQTFAEQPITQFWKLLERSPEDAAAVPISVRASKVQRGDNMMIVDQEWAIQTVRKNEVRMGGSGRCSSGLSPSIALKA
jgi:hypothetical protein